VIGISETVTLNSAEEQSIKTLNKIPYIRAAAEKVKRGLDEILILNEKGFIAEASSSNEFILKDNIWLTPQVGQGSIIGITRNKVTQLLKTSGIEVKEQKIKPNDLSVANSIMICNSVFGVKWVGSFKKYRFFKTKVKVLVDSLNHNLKLD
jgi:branched-chain amino acid aminotransferase